MDANLAQTPPVGLELALQDFPAVYAPPVVESKLPEAERGSVRHVSRARIGDA